MLRPRGRRGLFLASAGLVLAGLSACTPRYTLKPQDALPDPEADQAANPLASSDCKYVGAGNGPYVKRILVHSPPIQVVANDQVRLDATVLGLRRSYSTCSKLDSVVVVAENTTQYVKPTLEWPASSGLDTGAVNSTTWSIIATAEVMPNTQAVSYVATATSALIVSPNPTNSTIVQSEVLIDTVHFVPFPGVNSKDLLRTWFLPGTRANVAILAGLTNSGCENDRLVTFTNQADVGEWLGDCPGPNGQVERAGELVLFSETGLALRAESAWTSGHDTIVVGATDDLSSAVLEPLDPIIIPVKAWLSDTELPEQETWSFIMESIKLANSLLERNRTGLRVELVDEDTTNVEFSLDPSSVKESCLELAKTQLALPVDVSPPDTVHLFVTQKVDQTSGFSCRFPNGIILLGNGAGTTTFAHELGHTLSLRVYPEDLLPSREDPRTGHIDKNPNIGAWNVMYSTQSDDANQIRTHFTLGQAYRMNFDSRSWIVEPGVSQTAIDSQLRQSVQCQDKADAAGPCPSLHLDLSVLHPTNSEPQDQ